MNVAVMGRLRMRWSRLSWGEQADLVLVDLALLECTGDAAVVDDVDGVGHAHDLVELE